MASGMPGVSRSFYGKVASGSRRGAEAGAAGGHKQLNVPPSAICPQRRCRSAPVRPAPIVGPPLTPTAFLPAPRRSESSSVPPAPPSHGGHGCLLSGRPPAPLSRSPASAPTQAASRRCLLVRPPRCFYTRRGRAAASRFWLVKQLPQGGRFPCEAPLDPVCTPACSCGIPAPGHGTPTKSARRNSSRKSDSFSSKSHFQIAVQRKRLVQNDLRLGAENPRQRYPLLLTAGKLGGIVMLQPLQPEAADGVRQRAGCFALEPEWMPQR